MKKLSLLVLSWLFLLTFSTCILDHEPSIPIGGSNRTDPEFAASELIPQSDSSLRAKARLEKHGNETILNHGWLWSETPGVDMNDNIIQYGTLTSDSFEYIITGFKTGKPYYLAPFVTTGDTTIIYPEKCSFLGMRFSINTDDVIFRGADVKFMNQSAGTDAYFWDFGDGTTSPEESPTHTFNKTGKMTVRLTAKIGDCTAQKEMVLTVTHDPFEGYWVNIPGGAFQMGCTPDQKNNCSFDNLGLPDAPVHLVTLDPFLIGKSEITQRQWLAVTGNNPSFDYICGPDCPVESISWERVVQEFIPKLNRKTGREHRLPTEAEWEFAARGGQSFLYAGSDNLNTVGWYGDSNGTGGNAKGKLHEVMTKEKNGYGLYDMSGNVSEWCADWYLPGYYNISPKTNPSGPDSTGFRCLRGGSWLFSSDYCAVGYRNEHEPRERSKGYGFRMARSK